MSVPIMWSHSTVGVAVGPSGARTKPSACLARWTKCCSSSTHRAALVASVVPPPILNSIALAVASPLRLSLKPPSRTRVAWSSRTSAA
eukprot:22921-Prymnesium_polylepis.1